MFIDRRIGKFESNISTINNHSDVMREILRYVIVIGCTVDPVTNMIYYIGINDMFHPVATGETVPTYEVEYDSEAGVNWILQPSTGA